MKYKIALLTMVCTLCVSATMASPRDTARVEHLSMWNQLSTPLLTNPALHSAAYAQSYSEMALTIDFQHQSEAFVEEKGKGHVLGALAVNSYLRMNPRSAVWGSASYTTGKQKSICWNSTSDYELLAPYVMADTLGGDTHRERYTFSGGYGTQLGRVLLGGEMAIRAEHEYRDRDPRMRGIVTELLLRGGAGLMAWHYRWGVLVEGTIYKQTNSVDFYNELGVIPEYHMTGLGTEYGRFAGEQRSLAYRGGGFDIAFDAVPTDNEGLYGHVSLGRNAYERLLTSANSLPLSRLIYNKVETTMGWKQESKHHWAAYAHFAFTKRSGDENITGKSDSQYYPVIGKLTMYKDYLMDASIGGMYGQQGDDRSWMVSLKTGYRNHRERYVYPERLLDRAHAYVKVAGEWMRPMSRRLSLSLGADASQYARVSDNMVMPFANMTSKFAEMIRHKYRFVKASYTEAHLHARGDYHLKSSSIGLFAEVAGGMVLCSEREQQVGLRASVGVTF